MLYKSTGAAIKDCRSNHPKPTKFRMNLKATDWHIFLHQTSRLSKSKVTSVFIKSDKKKSNEKKKIECRPWWNNSLETKRKNRNGTGREYTQAAKYPANQENTSITFNNNNNKNHRCPALSYGWSRTGLPDLYTIEHHLVKITPCYAKLVASSAWDIKWTSHHSYWNKYATTW